MAQDKNKIDPYIGLQITDDYVIKEKVNKGKIGVVYKAERSNPKDILACKIIPEGNLKTGWQAELNKILRLRGISNVVQYHKHGSRHDHNSRQFTYILFDFIPGKNLKDYIKDTPSLLDIAFIENIARTVLNVLYACQAEEIQHGDLHEGNILIREPDKRLPGSPTTIWISDFGYGGSYNHKTPKDDYRHLSSTISNLINKLDPANLNPRDKVLHQKLGNFSKKKLLEVDTTQGNYVNNPASLLNDLDKLIKEAERESAAAGKEIKETSDYLWAEALGYRIDEWKNLFVPEFPSAQELLSKNITVLTGARGCGKTMSFRRLTAFMDKVIGEPSGVKGADQFVGFYVNCRDLVEAFPWLPTNLNEGMQQQIIQYFHLAWFSEITKTLAQYATEHLEEFEWLDKYLKAAAGGSYQSLPSGSNVLAHARTFIENEKERCRLTDLGELSGQKNWPFSRLDFLDILQALIDTNVPWFNRRPSYFFLDDYTIPIVTREVQQILNPIIFKRRSNLFFKVSTESSNSFEREGLHGKPLELHQDFELIDLARENIHLDYKEKVILLDKIFRPRIDRNVYFKGKNLGLRDVLGEMTGNNNELAWQMRKKKSICYHGEDSFVGIWTSDIRTIIQIFTNIVREANGKIKEGNLPIDKTIQNKCYKSAGGEFLAFSESVKDPSCLGSGSNSTRRGESYGTHLKDIVETFTKISKYELMEGELVTNQRRQNPKQAFKIEVIDKFELSDDALRYYEGLVRWHIFLQDWRGKSMRGMMTPRLYLNRILIPYSNLTFSSHDNIQLRNEEFINLLTAPKVFFEYWKKKRTEDLKQLGMFDTKEIEDDES